MLDIFKSLLMQVKIKIKYLIFYYARWNAEGNDLLEVKSLWVLFQYMVPLKKRLFVYMIRQKKMPISNTVLGFFYYRQKGKVKVVHNYSVLCTLPFLSCIKQKDLKL